MTCQPYILKVWWSTLNKGYFFVYFEKFEIFFDDLIVTAFLNNPQSIFYAPESLGPRPYKTSDLYSLYMILSGLSKLKKLKRQNHLKLKLMNMINFQNSYSVFIFNIDG